MGDPGPLCGLGTWRRWACGYRQRNAANRGTQGFSRDLQQVLVMGEEQDLRLLGELAQDAEAGRRALVVEVDEQVVRDERHGLGMVEIILYRGDPEREVELVRSAGAHAGDRYA